jgi:hypothetical protein
MTTPIPPQITTPDRVETRLGTLRFFDGVPDAASVDLLYDNLDFQRGVEAFLACMRGASLVAVRQGLREVGCVDGTIGVFDALLDSRSLFLTPNTETVYALAWLDLRAGPVVVESPPNTLGVVDDFWFDYVTDLGNVGPDRGQGGKYLFLPPGYAGAVPPPGYFTFTSPTYGNILIWRAFAVHGDPAPAAANIRAHARLYPLARAAAPPEQRFVPLSGRAFNTIHANDVRFYEELAELVDEEPAAALDPDTLGLLAAIGIAKGKPFAPDARLRRILTDAAAVGNATARAILFSPRIEGVYHYPGSHWQVGFVGGSHEFEQQGVRLLDARTRMFYYATGITPAMAAVMVGAGSQYAVAMRDATGAPFDGSRTYRLRLPPDPPVRNFWSIVLYDNQTRSGLQTDQPLPSLGSERAGLLTNPDGSVDLYFGPRAPAGKEQNWIQTVPGKGWNAILRLYGPLQPWFEQTWRPGEIEPLD